MRSLSRFLKRVVNMDKCPLEKVSRLTAWSDRVSGRFVPESNGELTVHLVHPKRP